jgi:SPP1 family predicted phage head-tail adaptor
MVWLLEGRLMPCIANYDRKVVIKNLTGTADAHGHIDNTAATNWSQYTTSYASVQSKGGREFWKVDQVNSDVSHVWRCPYAAALAAATPDMQLINEGVTYEIMSVIDIDLKHKEIEIQTRRAI